MKEKIDQYVKLIGKFCRDEISLEEFEIEYFTLFKNENYIFPVEIYEALNDVFTSLDMYDDDNQEDYFTMDMLKKAVSDNYNKLNKL